MVDIIYVLLETNEQICPSSKNNLKRIWAPESSPNYVFMLK